MAPKSCPACGATPSKTRYAPCDCCVVGCGCLSCGDVIGPCCPQPVRGWVKSTGARWKWHGRCDRCDKHRCSKGSPTGGTPSLCPAAVRTSPAPMAALSHMLQDGNGNLPVLSARSESGAGMVISKAWTSGQSELGPMAAPPASPWAAWQGGEAAGVARGAAATPYALGAVSSEALRVRPSSSMMAQDVAAESRRPPRGILSIIREAASDRGQLWAERFRGTGLSPFMRGLGVPADSDDSPGFPSVPRMLLFPGTGALHCATGTWLFVQSARVALTWALLHETAMEAAGFSIVRRLGSGRFDVWVSVLNQGISDGASMGVVLALHLLQAMTDCHFHADVTATGAMSLCGEVVSVSGVRRKVIGAALVEDLKTVFVPAARLPQAQAGLPQPSRLKVEAMHSMAELIAGVVKRPGRCGRVELPQDSLSYCSSKAVIAAGIMYTVEACVVPGSGQVHLTGFEEKAPLRTVASLKEHALYYLRQGGAALMAELFQPHMLGQPAPGGFRGLVVDLAGMRVTDLHPDADRYRGEDGEIPTNSIDLHLHIYNPNWDLAVDGHMYGGAGVVALVGLMTGLKPRDDVVVEADIHVDGTLSMAGDMELECLESTRDMGVRTLFMPPVDFTALVDRAPQVMQPGWPGPTVKPARTISEVLGEAYDLFRA